MRRGLASAGFVAAMAVTPMAHAGGVEMVIPLTGEVPDDGLDHFFVDFEVPAGMAEIEVRHDDESDANILDWGLQGPDGFRGWGGGNAEPAIVAADAASRSYSPGAIEAGTWQVIVGKAKIDEPPGTYAIEVVLRPTATLPAQDRTPYADAPALVEGPGWYAGDFHVHSRESGDASPTLEEIAIFAADRGLDFVVITDHNVHTSQDFFATVQPGADVLFVPGVEFTTYAGHATGLGATQWVDHKIGQPGVDILGAVAAFHDQGALFSINHPVLDIGDLCIGCAWNHDVPGEMIDAVEIATGGLQPFGWQFSDNAIAFWDALCEQGHHVAVVGGSDDHKAGVDLSPFQSPIGDATTLVYAAALDVPSIVQGVRDGRTVVKLQGPDDPTVMFDADATIDGDTITAGEVTLTAHIEGGMGSEVRLVHNGAAGSVLLVDADPFDATWPVQAPDAGEDRYRVEVLVEGTRRVVTSHLWLAPDPSAADDSGGNTAGTTGDGTGAATTTATGPATTGTDTTGAATGGGADDGCSCTTPARGPLTWAWLLLPFALRLRRTPTPAWQHPKFRL